MMSTVKTVTLSAMLSLAVGCGDEPETSGSRGAPANSTKGGSKDKKKKSRRRGGGAEEEEAIDEGPPRPPVALDSKSFQRRRDPFLSFVASEGPLPEPPSTSVRAERRVRMASYAFDDLKLISIVGGRGVTPRALFLASDGKSKTIKQGEYFSSAEVKLAAVNRDYVEIEVVDDDLGSSLNLQRGERRAIYLRTD
jgi:Tfp pilus assembly protein PilP